MTSQVVKSEKQQPSNEPSSKETKQHRLIISRQPPESVFSDEVSKFLLTVIFPVHFLIIECFFLSLIDVSISNLYLHITKWFEVGFDLASSFPQTVPPNDIELCANLYENVEGQCQNKGVKQQEDIDIQLTIQPSTANPMTDLSIVKCRIRSPSLKDDNPVFYNIHFFQRMRDTGNIIEEVEGVVSTKGKQ